MTEHTDISIKERVELIRERIAASAAASGRSASEVMLVGVTKTRTVEEMMQAVPFVDAIGENKVQEAAGKKESWGAAASPQWRLIGHLQTNKARRAIEIFDSIDSVDSVPLAVRLDRIAGELGRRPRILIEVNTAHDGEKTGASEEELPALLDCAAGLRNLELEGFMTIGPLTDDEAAVRGAFARLRELAEGARRTTGLALPVLSMGMSGDFEWAIAEGSTMVRVGTSIFGKRDYRAV